MSEYPQYLKLLLPSDAPFTSYSCETDCELGPLSLINIFIGANNSGKSRLLRALFVLDRLVHTATSYNAQPYLDLVDSLKIDFDGIFGGATGDIDGISAKHFDQLVEIRSSFIDPKAPIQKLIEESLAKLTDCQGRNISLSWPNRRLTPHGTQEIAAQIRKLGEKGLNNLNKINPTAYISDGKRFYTPILRGMRPLGNADKDFYQERTRFDYFSKIAPG